MSIEQANENHYSKDIIWNIIGQFSYLGFLWLVTIAVTRILGFQAAGVVSLAMVAANICTSVASFNLRLIYASDVSKRFSDADYFWARGVLCFLSLIICVVYCFVMNYPLATIGSILIFYGYKLCEMISDIFQGFMQRHHKLYLSGYTMTAKGVLSFAAFVLFSWLTKSLDAGLFGMLGVGIVVCFIEFFIGRCIDVQPEDLKPSGAKGVVSLLVLCLPFFAVTLCSSLLPSIPRVFFEKLYSTEELGYYASVATIAVLIQTAAQSVMLPVVPKIAHLYANQEQKKITKLILILVLLLLSLGFLASLLAYFVGDWALKLVFGEEIAPYTGAFVWAMVAAIFTGLVTVGVQILGAIHDRLWVTIGSIFGVAICSAISFAFCDRFYMNGVSFALIVSQAAEVLVFGFVITRKIQKAGKSLKNSE